MASPEMVARINLIFDTDAGAPAKGANAFEALNTSGDDLIQLINELGSAGDPANLPKLQQFLAHPNVVVRVHAAAAVAGIDLALGLPILEALLEEDDRSVRCQVVEILCGVKDERVSRVLARALLSLYQGLHVIDPIDDWTRGIRRKMAAALLRCEGSYALTSLLLAARDADLEVRRQAIWVLGVHAEDGALDTVEEALTDRHWEIRRAAVLALGNFRVDLVLVQLLETMHDPYEEVVLAAIKTAAFLGDGGAGPGLFKVMAGESDRAARAAFEALPEVGYGGVTVEGLAKLVHDADTDTEIKLAAVSAMGVTNSAEALPHLVHALCEPDTPVQMAAARAMGRLGNRRAVPHLAKALDAGAGLSEEVLPLVTEALGKLGDARAVPALEKTIESPNRRLSEAAQRALIRLGRAKIAPGGSEGVSARTRAHQVLMKRGSFTEWL